MYRGRSNLLPIIIMVIIAIVAIIALVSVGRAILSGDRTRTNDNAANRALLNTEADRSISMTVRGPIVAEEDFRSYEIVVSPIGRSMTLYKGYKREIINTVRLTNNTQAYTELVHALSLAGFANNVDLPEETDDIRGICATERLYTFDLLQAQSVRSESWTTSCRGIKGSFRGDAALARELIEAQIPNSEELLNDIDL